MSYSDYLAGFRDGYRLGYSDASLGLPNRLDLFPSYQPPLPPLPPAIEPVKYEPLPALDLTPKLPDLSPLGGTGYVDQQSRFMPQPGPGLRLGPPGNPMTW